MCVVCVCVCLIITPQNADPVKRQRGVHVEREHPWEALFNFLIVLQQPIQQFIQWCISDVSLCVCVYVCRERREGREGKVYMVYIRC